MTTWRWTLLAALSLPFSLSSGLPAAGPQQPAGTAAIAGVVMTTDPAPAPVRRAVVTLGSDDGWRRSAISDDAGRFVFTALPAGRYALKASRAGFVDAEHGARRPGRMGTKISLDAAQHLQDVVLHMARGAVIAGTVFQQSGEPAAGVSILVTRRQEVPSMLATRNTGLVTDDRGQYRAFGLAPGEYLVAAMPPSELAGAVRVPGTAEVDAILRDLQRGTAVAAQTAPARPPTETTQESARHVTYAPIFHPGTHLRPQADVVAVSAGDERTGVDIQLAPVPAVSIEGTVLSPAGPPEGVRLMISGASMPVPSGVNAAVLSERPGPDGRFRYTNVPAGRYTITARVIQPEPFFAVTEIDVGGQDVTGLVLALQPALTLSGRIQLAGTGPPPLDDLSSLRVILQPPPSAGGSVVRNETAFGQAVTAAGQSDASGAFRVRGILPGTYHLSVTTIPDGWWLRSAIVAGRDVLDEPLAIASSDLQGAVLTLTDERSELSGTLQTPESLPAVDYHVVIISADRRHWAPNARRTRVARPDTEGRFSFANLPAGDYLLVALDDVDPSDLDEPDFLAQLAPGGVPVRVADGERTVQDLRIGR